MVPLRNKRHRACIPTVAPGTAVCDSERGAERTNDHAGCHQAGQQPVPSAFSLGGAEPPMAMATRPDRCGASRLPARRSLMIATRARQARWTPRYSARNTPRRDRRSAASDTIDRHRGVDRERHKELHVGHGLAPQRPAQRSSDGEQHRTADKDQQDAIQRPQHRPEPHHPRLIGRDDNQRNDDQGEEQGDAWPKSDHRHRPAYSRWQRSIAASISPPHGSIRQGPIRLAPPLQPRHHQQQHHRQPDQHRRRRRRGQADRVVRALRTSAAAACVARGRR